MTRAVLVTAMAAVAASAAADGGTGSRPLAADPVLEWSNEARRAIVPPGRDGISGAENYGNKFPGEAALYMGIVHAAMYEAAAAIGGGRPYAARIAAPAEVSAAAAVATAAHRTLTGLQPALGLTPAQQAMLDGRLAASLARIAEGPAKANGIAVGRQAAAAVLASRANDGREKDAQLGDLGPPPQGPGVWDPGTRPALGLRLPFVRPLALERAAQFRPGGPPPLSSTQYAADFREVRDLGRAEAALRRAEQTEAALFWTDHDLRQWNDGLLRLAAGRGLDLVAAARMLALAHVAGADAMLACFDAKYAYWFWRPHQAIPRADQDGNPGTEPDPAWRPLRETPNFPEYPSAHACHSAAVAEALAAFFGTDEVRFSLDSRVTGTTRDYERLHDVVRDVDDARVLVGFHFRTADRDGAILGRQVGAYVAGRFLRKADGAGVISAAPPR